VAHGLNEETPAATALASGSGIHAARFDKEAAKDLRQEPRRPADLESQTQDRKQRRGFAQHAFEN